jgi:hypothetical protein
LEITALNASNPPADAPMTMVSREGMQNVKSARRLLIDRRHFDFEED